MMHFTERVLTDELAEAKCLLQRALAILDAHDEHATIVRTDERQHIIVARTARERGARAVNAS